MRRTTARILALLIYSMAMSTHAQTWQQIGPDGGFFKDFAIHPTDSDIVYAGSDDGGGVWKSLDAGESWTLLTADFPNFTGWHVEIDPNDPQTMYSVGLYGRYGVLKSVDGGDSWVELSNGLESFARKQQSKLAVASIGGDTLLLSTGEGPGANNAPRPGDGVLRSVDGGLSWSPSGFQGQPVPCVEHTSGIVFAGTAGGGLYASADHGDSWLLHSDIPDTAYVHQVEAEGEFVAVATDLGVFLSVNFGIDFAPVGMPFNFNFDIDILRTAPSVQLIVPAFDGPKIYDHVTGIWSDLGSPDLDGLLIIGIASAGEEIYLGPFSSTPIVKSTDGGSSWQRLADNPIATEVPSILSFPDSPILYAALQNAYQVDGSSYNQESMARSDDGGLTWTRTGPFAHGLELEASPSDPMTIYLGTFAQGVFKSTDGSETWTDIRTGNKLIGDIDIDPQDPTHLLISEVDLTEDTFGIYQSTDAGENWSAVGAFPANKLAFDDMSDRVYASAASGLFMSTDNGATWPSSPSFLEGSEVLEVIVHQGVAYAGTKTGGLFEIQDDLVEEVSGPWDTPVEVKNMIVVGEGLYVGLNGAEQDTIFQLSGSLWKRTAGLWTDISDGLVNTNIFGPEGLSYTNGTLYVGTYGSGVLASTDIVDDVEEEMSHDHSYRLFPNPATDRVRIDLGEGYSDVETVTLHSPLGEVVARHNVGGRKQLFLDLSGLAKGPYLVEWRMADRQLVSSTLLVVD